MTTDHQVQVHWHDHAVSHEEREKLNRHNGCVIWFTGLSACGKSTVANLLDHKLHSLGLHSFVLDGDNIRHGLNAGPGMLKERHGEEFAKRFGLGFSAQDREENIRRIGAVAKLFSDAGIIAITALSALIEWIGIACAQSFRRAISSKSLSMPPWRCAKPGIPKDFTKRPDWAKSRDLQA